MSAAPAPLLEGELDEFLAQTERGVPFKQALEELLLSLPLDRAEHLMLFLREGRAAWFPLLKSSGGPALVIGNAFSGTTHALAAAGFQLTILDPSPQRMRFEAVRCEALTGHTPTLVEGGLEARLPFEDDSFELVVQEDGLPEADGPWGHDAEELRRVSRGEVLVVADNRLGYKRSLGARGEFAVPSPLQYVLDVARRSRGAHTLGGYRRRLTFGESVAPRAFALYPHSMDFAHVVGLDESGPALHIGPMERRNKLKMLGQRAGLFPLLTPSFALISETRALKSQHTRIERILSQLAERLGEPTPRVDELVATRGNTALVQTRLPGSDPEDPAGRWSLHVPLSPQQERQLDRHHAVIERLWESRQLPVPEPLFRGTLEGVSLSCERRLGGLAAPQLSGDPQRVERTLTDLVEQLSSVVVRESRPLDSEEFERYFGARFDLVARFCGRPETQRSLSRLRDRTRERVMGLELPLVLYHADLRSKHLQVDEAGRILGYLDWGSSLDADLPYSDLLQFLVHELKQSRCETAQQAWEGLGAGGPVSGAERSLLDRYADRLGLSKAFQLAMEGCFPVFVAAMAEANWDYSRPRWLHRQFGV